MEIQQAIVKERIIRPKKGFAGIDFKELWQYRELFWFLALRDIMIRYKQAVLGIAWAVIEPIMIMIVFTVIFGKVAKLPDGGIPYPVLTFVAVLPWNLFSKTLAQSSNSLVSNAQMISKVYFPRLIMPAGSVIAGCIDFVISLVILALLMLYYGVLPTAAVFFLPIFFLLAVLVSLGAGLWFSALNVMYRDIKYIIPFIIRLGLYVSPVGFSSSVIPEKYRLLYSLNPMVGVIDGFRWCLLGGKAEPYWPGLWMSVLMAILLVATGALYFRKTERTFADVI
jgi:lipopolysaccharide transport system permease protein